MISPANSAEIPNDFSIPHAPAVIQNSTSFTQFKTHSAAEIIFKTLFVVFLLLPVIGWATAFIINRIDRHRSKELRIEIDQARWKAIEKAANAFKNVIKETKEPTTTFDRRFNKLQKYVFSSPITLYALREQALKVQKTISKLFADPYYIQAKKEGDPRITMIGEFALALRTDVRGTPALQKFGKLQTQQVLCSSGKDERYSFQDLGNTLTAAFNNSHSTTMDFFPDIIIWAITHPLNLLEAIKGLGVFGYDPVRDYNPYVMGNVNIAGWDYSLSQNSPKVRFAFGPGPGITTDRLLEAQLDLQKANGGIHLQHAMEHPLERGELPRLLRLKEIEKQYPGTFRLMMTPLNGPAWKMRDEFLKWDSPEEFLKLYKNFACTGSTTNEEPKKKAYRSIGGESPADSNGFYIGKEVMSDAQFENAFDCVGNIFNSASKTGNPYVKEMLSRGKDGKIMLGKGMQVFTQALAAMGALTKVMQEADFMNIPEKYLDFSQACREDIDRGVVLNIATKLLFYVSQGKQLKKEDIEQIVGETLGRAELVINRRILLDKVEGLAAFIFLLGSGHQAFIKKEILQYLSCNFQVKESEVLNCQSLD